MSVCFLYWYFSKKISVLCFCLGTNTFEMLFTTCIDSFDFERGGYWLVLACFNRKERAEQVEQHQQSRKRHTNCNLLVKKLKENGKVKLN
jgi:hypothetical protein